MSVCSTCNVVTAKLDRTERGQSKTELLLGGGSTELRRAIGPDEPSEEHPETLSMEGSDGFIPSGYKNTDALLARIQAQHGSASTRNPWQSKRAASWTCVSSFDES